MSQDNKNERIELSPAENDWGRLYLVAGAGALLALALMLLDIGLTFAGGDVEVGRMSAEDWFALYQRDWFMGLRNFGFINVLSLIVALPLYLALYWLHRKAYPAFAALALIVYLFGAVIYTSSNQALTLLTLSRQFSEAQSEAQKATLLTAGAVIVAQAEDFTPGTILGFTLTTSGSILMMAVMLGAGVFGKRPALAGLGGSSSLLVFTIIVTFIPYSMGWAMALALLGGLLMMGWNVAVALGMFRLGRSLLKRRSLALQAG
jgi:hypothetical protein